MTTVLAPLARLIRPRVCLFAVLASLTGYALARPQAEAGMALAATGAFFLAAGCSALNQVQERRQDALMRRTADRPLPAGQWTWPQALALAVSLLALSLGLLAQVGGLPLAGLWLAVLLIYNGLYTPLKRVTPLCILVGGLAGALPPVLGWMAAGGRILDYRIVLVAGVLYFWQVPHFGLFARMHRTDYQTAGFPVAALPARSGQSGQSGQFGRSRFPLFVWLLAYSAGLLQASALGLVSGPGQMVVTAMALGLALAWPLTRNRERLGFALVNASMLCFLATLALTALWPGA